MTCIHMKIHKHKHESMKISKIYINYMKKYTKKLKYFKTWYIKPKFQSKTYINSLEIDMHSHVMKNYVQSPKIHNNTYESSRKNQK